jgi:protein-tyrosine phosphatase
VPRAVKSEPFRILFVCTGNICRSPMAQAMLLHRLRAHLGVDTADRLFDVSSAGTGAVVGQPIEDFAVDALASLGVTPDPFSARDIDEGVVAGAGVVLTATRAHRAAVVSLVPRVVRRTFTLREFARFVAEVDMAVDMGVDMGGDMGGDMGEVAAGGSSPAERLASLVEQATALRGFVRPDAAEDDDVDDPYRRPADAFQRAAAEIDVATTVIAERLAACVDPAPGRD